MPWKYNNKIIRAGKAWVDDEGYQHPKNWMVWSDADKVSRGMVWENDPVSFDNRFYWSVGNAKNLDDTLWVDEDGDAVIDDMTGEQGVTLGLKSQYKAQTKEQASNLLSTSDWQIVKATEVSDYTVPSAVTTYRAAVRTASNSIETSIDNAADIDAFIALWDVPVDSDGEPTGKAPINNWPDEV